MNIPRLIWQAYPYKPARPHEISRLRKQSNSVKERVRLMAKKYLNINGFTRASAEATIKKMSLHHIIPLYAGGDNALHNLAYLSVNHHTRIHTFMDDQLNKLGRYGGDAFYVAEQDGLYKPVWMIRPDVLASLYDTRPWRFEWPENTLG